VKTGGYLILWLAIFLVTLLRSDHAHTPGHQSVIVEDRVAITGDVLVHAVQLVAPEAGYAHEMDQDLARATRIALLSRDLTLATPHLSSPFVTPSRE
jgi:glyoxylase-like metal-dependent hydrolase (beta-lactamase superfamily II)